LSTLPPVAIPTVPRFVPPPEARESLQPPPPRVRARPALSPIEQTAWVVPAAAFRAAPAPSVAPPPSAAPPPAPSAPPPAAEEPAAPATHSSGPPPLPEADPSANEEPIGLSAAPAGDRNAARELAQWERELLSVGDRERLLELAFSIAGCFAVRVALFSVHQGMIQGLRCVERGIARPVDGLLMPLEVACMLTEVATRREALRIDPRARPADQRVEQLLADEQSSEVVLFPVAIKQRVVNVLYASNRDERIGPTAFGALQLLAQEMSQAYGRIILARKAGAAPA
jgi:hypothetical protein